MKPFVGGEQKIHHRRGGGERGQFDNLINVVPVELRGDGLKYLAGLDFLYLPYQLKPLGGFGVKPGLQADIGNLAVRVGDKTEQIVRADAVLGADLTQNANVGSPRLLLIVLPRRIIMRIYLFFGFASTFAYLILSWSKIFLTFE
ncbi:MAG: hypothetical protein LBP22_12340 [Deltaproteobacteria bacterium]|jgi:hypothetical protein|nr:hypothetical protein [Deltaproteobacteria bacterium]